MDLPPFDKLGRGDTVIGIGATVVDTPESLTPDEQQSMVNDMAGRCRDCRWWGRDNDGDEPPGFSVCGLVSFWFEQERPIARLDRLSSSMPFLYADPDFGCISWRAKAPV